MALVKEGDDDNWGKPTENMTFLELKMRDLDDPLIKLFYWIGPFRMRSTRPRTGRS